MYVCVSVTFLGSVQKLTQIHEHVYFLRVCNIVTVHQLDDVIVAWYDVINTCFIRRSQYLFHGLSESSLQHLVGFIENNMAVSEETSESIQYYCRKKPESRFNTTVGRNQRVDSILLSEETRESIQYYCRKKPVSQFNTTVGRNQRVDSMLLSEETRESIQYYCRKKPVSQFNTTVGRNQ